MLTGDCRFQSHYRIKDIIVAAMLGRVTNVTKSFQTIRNYIGISKKPMLTSQYLNALELQIRICLASEKVVQMQICYRSDLSDRIRECTNREYPLS